MDLDLHAKIETLAEVLRGIETEIREHKHQFNELAAHQLAIQTAFAGIAVIMQQYGAASAIDLAVAIRQVRSSSTVPVAAAESLDRYLDGLEKMMMELAFH